MDDYRCPRHGCIISNDMFDAYCSACEGESDEAAERWEYDRKNPFRFYCDAGVWILPEPRWIKTCNDPLSSPDDIPF